MPAEPIRPVFSTRLLDWTGYAILYFFLLAIPFVTARWLAEVLPIVLQPVGRIVANAVILPFLYLCLHLVLRMLRARCQNFIVLVVPVFAWITYMELQRAERTGDYNSWVSAWVVGIYVLIFAAFSIHSLIAIRRERALRRQAAERAETVRQTQAFHKARQVGP